MHLGEHSEALQSWGGQGQLWAAHSLLTHTHTHTQPATGRLQAGGHLTEHRNKLISGAAWHTTAMPQHSAQPNSN